MLLKSQSSEMASQPLYLRKMHSAALGNSITYPDFLREQGLASPLGKERGGAEHHSIRPLYPTARRARPAAFQDATPCADISFCATDLVSGG